MYNEKYYEDKKKKLEEKFNQKKDSFLTNLFNIVNSIQGDLNDIKLEHAEVVKAEEESKKEEAKKENAKESKK